MDILHLREVGRMPQIEPEPGAPEGVLGVARLHGQPVRVLELARCLGVSGGGASGAHRPWLIVSRGEHGDEHWLVDAVQDIVEYDPTQIRAGAASGAAREERRTAGLIEIDGRLTYLLTPDLLAGARAA